MSGYDQIYLDMPMTRLLMDTYVRPAHEEAADGQPRLVPKTCPIEAQHTPAPLLPHSRSCPIVQQCACGLWGQQDHLANEGTGTKRVK